MSLYCPDFIIEYENIYIPSGSFPFPDTLSKKHDWDENENELPMERTNFRSESLGFNSSPVIIIFQNSQGSRKSKMQYHQNVIFAISSIYIKFMFTHLEVRDLTVMKQVIVLDSNFFKVLPYITYHKRSFSGFLTEAKTSGNLQ